jgi:hypothetical protein
VQHPADTAASASLTELGVLFVAALAALVTLFTAPAPGHAYPAVFRAGAWASTLGLTLALARHLAARRFSDLRLTFDRFAPLPIALVALGVAGLVGRHVHDFRVFASAHASLFGLPSELAFVLLAVGLGARRDSLAEPSVSGPRRASVVLALGLVWGLVSLLTPEVALQTSTVPLVAAFAHPLTGLAALGLLGVLTLAAWVLAHDLLGRPTLAPRVDRVVPCLFALPALSAESPFIGLAFAAILAALSVLARPLVARPILARRDGRILEASILLCIIGLWLLLKSHALIASNTDENIYFYMAKLLGDGKWPYVDYFFAHPPLHVVLPGLFFATLGFSLTLAKLFPLIACLIGGLAVWAIARRALSPIAAPLALVLFLFAAEVLKASSNMTGVNMTSMFLLLGAWQAFAGRPFISGVLLGLAPATGFYAIGPALAFVAIGFFAPPSAGPLARLRRLRLAQFLAFASVLGGLNLVFWAMGGDTFLEGVYAYHQQKSFMEPDMVELFGAEPGFPASLFHNLGVMRDSEAFTKEVFYHPHLWLGGLLLPLAILGRWLRNPTRRKAFLTIFRPSSLHTTGPEGHALTLWLVTVALFVQYAMFRELYSFYFALIYPFLALCLAALVTFGVTLLTPSSPQPRRWRLLGAALGLLALLGVSLHQRVSLAHQAVFDDELMAVGSRNDYTWTDAPIAASLSPIVRNLFWEDARLKGDLEPGYSHYLWTKKRGFSRLDEVASYIKARSTPDETLAGASTLAPLVALLADRRIAADEIDTNYKRFKTGLLDEREYWRSICRDNVRFIVSAPRSYFTRDKLAGLPVIQRFFGSPVVFEDDSLMYRQSFSIALYERTSSTPCAWPD